jgi:hypothetical protein
VEWKGDWGYFPKDWGRPQEDAHRETEKLSKGGGSQGAMYIFCFWVGLEFEFRASHLQSRHSTAWDTPPVHFPLVILEIESCKLFTQAGL